MEKFDFDYVKLSQHIKITEMEMFILKPGSASK